eukprot:s5020_g1.t1
MSEKGAWITDTPAAIVSRSRMGRWSLQHQQERKSIRTSARSVEEQSIPTYVTAASTTGAAVDTDLRSREVPRSGTTQRPNEDMSTSVRTAAQRLTLVYETDASTTGATGHRFTVAGGTVVRDDAAAKRRYVYRCPRCRKTVDSGIRDGRIDNRRHCGHRFTVAGGTVVRDDAGKR